MGVLKSPFPKEVYERNSKIYQILANSKRLEILNTIKYKEATVTQLCDILKLRKANISQHLSILRHNKIVKTRREGQNIFYTISDPRIIEPCLILKNIWK